MTFTNIKIWAPNNYKLQKMEKKKKRKRISHTCTSCKTRKVKCDQKRPCSSCLKKNIPAYLCIYDSSPLIPTSDNASISKESMMFLAEENKRLKKELDEIRFQSSGSNLRGSSKLLKRFHSLTYKKNKVMYNGPTSWRSLIESKPDLHDTIEIAKIYMANARREWKVIKNLKKPDLKIYKDLISFVPEELLKNLATYLPNFFKVREYLEIYFHSYWHYKNPFVDPREVMKSFHELFQTNLESDNFQINAESKMLNYSKIALIILIFKFVLIQTNAIDVTQTFDEKDHLLKFVDRLLVFSKSDKKACLPVLQCLLIRHQMKKINPFEDDSGDGSNAVLNLRNAMSMVILLGLNTDIDTLYADKDLSYRQTLRAIWDFSLKEDTIISFYLGIPMSISDEYIHKTSLDMSSKDIKLTMLIRRANKFLISHDDCSDDELIKIVSEIEEMESGSLTNDIRSLETPEDYVIQFPTIRRIETTIMAIYCLHVLYEVIYLGLVDEYPDDPLVDAAYNGAFKYGSLVVTHLIELLLRLEDVCRAIDDENKKNNGFFLNKVHNIVEVSSSIVSLSKLAFLKAYCTICSHIVKGLTSGAQNEIKSSLIFPMAIDEFEKLDIRDRDSQLNKFFKDPGFLHSLITLACKHMLNINNESYGKVFNFNFCLYAVITLYKYFNNFLKVNLPKERVEMAIKIQPSIIYNNFKGLCTSQSALKSAPQPISHLSVNGRVNPPRGPNILNPIDNPPLPIQPDCATLSRTNAPQTSTSMPPNLISDVFFSQNHGFFEWKNDAVDELFNNILNDMTLFTLGEQNNAVNWSLDEFFNPGSGKN